MSTTTKRHLVEAIGAEATFKRWLDRGEAIGVFENRDMGHPGLGRMIFLPITPEEQTKLVVGKTRAPDTDYGLGWRYILQAVEGHLDAFEFRIPKRPINYLLTGPNQDITKVASRVLREFRRPGSYSRYLRCTYPRDPEGRTVFGTGLWGHAVLTVPEGTDPERVAKVLRGTAIQHVATSRLEHEYAVQEWQGY